MTSVANSELDERVMGIMDLLNQNGFAWDEICKIVAADVELWEACMKDHLDAIAYRDRISYL